MAAAVIVKIVFGKLGDSLVLQKDLAALKLVKSTKQIEPRRFAAAALTKHKHHAAIGQGERNMIKSHTVGSVFAFVDFG